MNNQNFNKKNQHSNIDIRTQHQQTTLTQLKENNLIYDRYGIINLNILSQKNLQIFFIGLIVFIQFVLIGVWAIKYKYFISNIDIYLELMGQYFYSFYTQFDKMKLSDEFIFIHSLALLFTILVMIVFNIYIYKKSKVQKRLSSVGLSNYYLKSKKNNIYIFKLRLGEVMEYDKFLKSFENIKQTFSKSNVKFERYNETEIKVIFIENFPTIKDLKGLSPKDYLLPNKIFLGFGINTNPKSKDKFEAKYLDMDNIPVGIANLGSAGGGKSNTMNQWLYSIFYNFNRIQKFYFIDFKGGIESEPINDLEKKHKTGKIEILDDNRLRLYQILKQLNIINKARMLYLKTNKLKKFVDNYIYVIFDELAEILDYEPKEKSEKQIQNEISAIIESLLRTGRSQGIKIFYSTQSFLSTSSGLTSGMKNNTKLRVLHQTKNKMAIGNVIPMEELEENGYDPYNYNMGRNLVISDEEMIEVRSLYIPEDFLDEIEINSEYNTKLAENLKEFYKIKIDELITDRDKLSTKSEEIYSLEDIAKDLDIEISNTTTKEDIKPSKKDSVKVSLKNIKEDTPPREEIKDFLSKVKAKKKESPITDEEIEQIDIKKETLRLKKTISSNKINIDVDKELQFLEEN